MHLSVLGIRHESRYICRICISLEILLCCTYNFYLICVGQRNRVRIHKSLQDCLTVFHVIYDIEICSGLLMVTHISDALICYNALNFSVSQLLEP